MTHLGLYARNFKLVRFISTLVVLLAVLPSLSPQRIPFAQASNLTRITLEQPSMHLLQAAFATVSAGHLPIGYPQIGDGWNVPVSLLKAVAWTESRWRQFVSPGHTLVSGDGGYGLMQITSGMDVGGMPPITRSAIAHNYVYNIAYGAQLLVQKLLKTPNIGNDDPAVLEHWYYALWAYNGWGWYNNPNNPMFTRVGTPATNPVAFPYQERVFYWLAHPPVGPDGQTLWPPIPVTLPDPKLIGNTPGPLPEVATPHTDITLPVSALSLGDDLSARFLKDLTIPDGTTLKPGQPFKKAWRVRNDGSLGWTEGYRWMPVAGPALGAPEGVPVAGIPPLADVSIAVNLIAPTQPGTYHSYWQMVGPRGNAFGTRMWVAIRVAGSGGKTHSGLDTGIVSAAGAPSTASLAQARLISSHGSRPAVRVESPTRSELATYNGDVNVPDGTVFTPGAHFVKTWRMQNSGTAAWTTDFHWHFEAGTLMSSVMSVAAPSTAPGRFAEFSVQMVAPMSTGVYTSFWQMTDASGVPFPTQAWVSIVVRQPEQTAPAAHASATPSPTPQPSATPTARPAPPKHPSATPSASDTPAPATSPTLPVSPTLAPPTETATATSTASLAAPSPTIALPGGNGELTGSPWEGALTYRTYFPAGSTKGPTRETLGFYYPGKQVAHLLMTVYRPDAASRTFAFTLGAGDRRAISLNDLAPGTGLATVVEADRRVVVNRTDWTTGSLMTDPGAPRMARSWYFAAMPENAPVNSRLIFFNPHEAPTSVEVKIGRLKGGCCTADLHLNIPPLKQFEFQPGVPGLLDGPMILSAADAVAVERVGEASDHVTEIDIPGSTATASQWYLPVVHSDKGGLVTIFNPGTTTVTAKVQVSVDEGPGAWLQRDVPPFSAVAVPVGKLTHLELAAITITASAPVFADAVWYVTPHQPAAYPGVPMAGNSWAIVTGLSDPAFVDTLEIENPTPKPVRATISLAGPKGTQRSWRILLPPQSRYAKVINKMIAPGPAVILVDGTGPIVASHTLTGIVGSSTTAGALLP